jgi:Zn-dependent metalloprotease
MDCTWVRSRSAVRACRPGQHRHPFHCIVPPHIMEQIALRGSPAQRDAALATLETDEAARATRALRNVQAQPLRSATRAQRLFSRGLSPTTDLERALEEAVGAAEIFVHDAQNGERLPGTLVRSGDDQPTNDPAVDEAYDGLLATYDFYQDVFERDSIDDNGLPLHASVHYGQDYDNAFWDGQLMVFGDGDNDLFNRFTIALDVIGHELTHGVTEAEAGLIYRGQPGALNESISDVFGSLIKQYQQEQTAEQADWLIGAGLLGPNVQGRALRDMANPGTAYDDDVLGKDPQPAHMQDFVRTFDDNGGVHINSGIPNRAFYQVAVNLGGAAWERAGEIWYAALQSPLLRPVTRFQGFASLTQATAVQLYGVGSREVQAVRDGWAEVGIVV